MSACSNPGKMSACEASRQTMFRATNFSNASPDFGRELREIVWRKVFSCVTGMRPNKFHGIELRCTGRKSINMQTRLRLNKVLDQASLMNGMVVPDQDNRTCNAPQELFEEQDHMFTTQIHSKGSCRQLHFSSTGTNQNCTQQVQSLMVVQTGVRTRSLSTGCPTASQWRNQ
jgi:hypothetical protein